MNFNFLYFLIDLFKRIFLDNLILYIKYISNLKGLIKIDYLILKLKMILKFKFLNDNPFLLMQFYFHKLIIIK
jgi:hypothetical protein